MEKKERGGEDGCIPSVRRVRVISRQVLAAAENNAHPRATVRSGHPARVGPENQVVRTEIGGGSLGFGCRGNWWMVAAGEAGVYVGFVLLLEHDAPVER